MNMERSSLRIWPILYFKADWPAETHNFAFDVRLIRVSEEILDIVSDETTEACASNNSAMCNFLKNTEWFLSLPVAKPTEHVSSNEIGIAFEKQLQEAIAESFLMCLRLTRQTAAICSLEINNIELAGERIDPDSFRSALDRADYFGINTDSPEVFMPESFQLGDLRLLSDLWSAVIRLRNFDEWSKWIYREEFFAASGYLTKDPLVLGSIKGQDFLKLIIGILIIAGGIFSTLGYNFLINFLGK